MGNNRKTTFIANYRWQSVLKNYPPEIRLAVYDAMFEYAATGEIPNMDTESMMAFFFIKAEIDENQTRYEEMVETNRENGRRGGAPKGNQNAKKKGITETSENKQNNRPLEKQPDITETSENNLNDMICNDIISEEEIKPKGFTKKKTELTLPYTSQEFINTWEMLCQQPKWKKKTDSALQMSLKKLGKYPEKFAIHLMEDAIAGGYQGIVFNDTDIKFQQWQKNASTPREPTKPIKIITSINKL